MEYPHIKILSSPIYIDNDYLTCFKLTVSKQIKLFRFEECIYFNVYFGIFMFDFPRVRSMIIDAIGNLKGIDEVRDEMNWKPSINRPPPPSRNIPGSLRFVEMTGSTVSFVLAWLVPSWLVPSCRNYWFLRAVMAGSFVLAWLVPSCRHDWFLLVGMTGSFAQLWLVPSYWHDWFLIRYLCLNRTKSFIQVWFKKYISKLKVAIEWQFLYILYIA